MSDLVDEYGMAVLAEPGGEPPSCVTVEPTPVTGESPEQSGFMTYFGSAKGLAVVDRPLETVLSDDVAARGRYDYDFNPGQPVVELPDEAVEVLLGSRLTPPEVLVLHERALPGFELLDDEWFDDHRLLVEFVALVEGATDGPDRRVATAVRGYAVSADGAVAFVAEVRPDTSEGTICDTVRDAEAFVHLANSQLGTGFTVGEFFQSAADFGLAADWLLENR